MTIRNGRRAPAPAVTSRGRGAGLAAAAAALAAAVCTAACGGDSLPAPGTADRGGGGGGAALSTAPGATCHYRGALPDSACTPGDTDPRVTVATVRDTICRSGYSTSVRPPASVTEPIKRERMAAYGVAGTPLADIELDHLVPLSIGGASTVANLWPEPRSEAARKDALEERLHELVCAGRLDIATAQRAISTDWVAAAATYAAAG